MKQKLSMELVNLFTNILDAHTRAPNFKPFLGIERREEGSERVPSREENPKRTIFVRKPEIASGEKFKSSISANPQDRSLTPQVSEEMGRSLDQIPGRIEGVENFSRGKIRQAV